MSESNAEGRQAGGLGESCMGNARRATSGSTHSREKTSDARTPAMPESINPQAMFPEQVAKVLTACGSQPVTVKMIQADVDDGAPTNPDNSINLVHYFAWLLKEIGRGD